MAQQFFPMARLDVFSRGRGSAKVIGKARLPNPRLLLLFSVGALVLLACTVIGAILYAVHSIDDAAIRSELERGRVALAVTMADAEPTSPQLAQRIAHDFALVGAHFTVPSSVNADEITVPIAGTAATVLAWTPRRFGSEMFFLLAPVRLLASAVFLSAIALALYRLYGLTTELEARRRAAQEQAGRDALTGLGNRLAFDDALQRIADGKRTPVAMLYIDLDEFKRVNDTMGHVAGDALLAMVGARLAGFARDGDLIARIGGDEFAILRTSATDRNAIAELAGDIRLSLSEPFQLGKDRVTVGASIGIATMPDGLTSGPHLVAAADAALYRAKSKSGGQHAFAEDHPGNAGQPVRTS